MNHLTKGSIQFKVLIGLIVAASCFRVFICFAHSPLNYLWSDALRHWNNGLYFPRGGYGGAADPIGYQVYIFVLQKLTASNKFLIGLASAVLSVLMPWTYYRAARNFGLAKPQALWVWTLIAWAPSLIVIYHFIMMETLLLLLEGLALWMTARYLRKGGTEAFLVFVFSWTIACLTKPTVIPLAGVCFLCVWWKKSTSLRQIALGTALAFVLLLPQAVRSKIELGFFAPFGNPWLTRIQLRCGTRSIAFHFLARRGARGRLQPTVEDSDFVFGSPSAFMRPLEPLSHWAIRRAWGNSKTEFTVDAAHGEQDWKNTYDSFNHDRREWLAQWRENIVLFFFAPSWPESGASEWDGYLDYCSRWIWAPLILFIFALNIRDFARRRFNLIPVAVTLFTLFMALQNMVLTEGRYRKPVEPLLLLNLVWIIATTGKEDYEFTPISSANLGSVVQRRVQCES